MRKTSIEPYRFERVRRKFGKRQGIPLECKFVLQTGRYRVHEPNLFETPPKWEEDSHPP